MIACVLIGLVPYLLHGQGYRITGQVTDGLHVPIADAKVILQEAGIQTTTDNAGNFSFDGLVSDTYSIRVSKRGYDEQVITATIESKHLEINARLNLHAHLLDEVLILEDRVQRRKKEESLNVEVVDREFIHRNLGGSLMNTLERLPGIQAIGIGSGQSKPLIRGLGFNRLQVIDNGIKHEGQQWGADHGLELDQFAVGEVELVKGAASFMHGSDAIAGVVDVKPETVPSRDTVLAVVDLIGKTNNGQYGASVRLAAHKMNWFTDGRATYQRYGDYRVPTDTAHIYDYPVPLHKNRLRNTAGLESGLHLHSGYIGERFRSVVYLSNSYSKSGFFANAHGLEPRRVDTDLHDRTDRDMLLPRQHVNHFKIISRNALSTGSHRLVLEAGFQHNFRQEFNNYVNHGYMPPIYPDTLGIPSTLERAFDKRVYSLNFRDHITLGRHEFTIGINGELQNNAINGWSFLVPAFKQQTFGVFAYKKYRWSERVLLHGAVRFDHGHLRTETYEDWFPSGDGPASTHLIRSTATDRRFNSFVWSIGINVNEEQFNLKANIGKSFRIPIAKELTANGVNYHYFSYERGDPELSPEKSYQADATFTWDTDRWMLQVSPFYNYFPNYIYLNPTSTFDFFYGAGNQVFQYAQSQVMRYGGEAEITYRFTEQLNLSLLGEYLYAEQLSGAKMGYTLPFSPPPSLLVNVNWSPRIGNLLRDPYLSLDYRRVGRQHRIVPPERKTEGYGLMSMGIGATFDWLKKPVEFNVQVLNLLNEKYMNHISFYRLIGLHEASRNIVLSLRVPLSS